MVPGTFLLASAVRLQQTVLKIVGQSVIHCAVETVWQPEPRGLSSMPQHPPLIQITLTNLRCCLSNLSPPWPCSSVEIGGDQLGHSGITLSKLMGQLGTPAVVLWSSLWIFSEIFFSSLILSLSLFSSPLSPSISLSHFLSSTLSFNFIFRRLF